jgi:hypothetical protein
MSMPMKSRSKLIRLACWIFLNSPIIFDLDHLKDYYSKSSFYEKSDMLANGLNKVDNSLSFSENTVIDDYFVSLMDMLLDAIRLVDKSFIFDNSGEKPIMIANSDKDEISVLEEGNVPYWFKEYVLDKLG